VTTRVDELRKIPLFSRLSSVDLEFLAARMDEIEVPAGSVLITEGMGNHAFYLLAHGEVDVFVGGTHRRSLGPNDFFGEISMMVLVPATATVVTRTPVRA
jgi:CRP-like cAMP-binding protein